MAPQKKKKRKKQPWERRGWRPKEPKRTPEQQALYEQWLKHKAEIDADRTRMRNERVNALGRGVWSFLKPVGVSVAPAPDGLIVGGKRFVFSGPEVKHGDAGLTVDRLASELLLEHLERAVVAELADHGFQLKAFRTHDGIRLRDETAPVALIKASRASIGEDATAIQGNFLAPGGSHWDDLRRRLWRTSVSEVLTHLPASGSEGDRNMALDASVQIRNERSREFGHTVVLRRGEASVRFEPIPEHGTVQVPLEFRAGDSYLVGGLRLKAPQDPLALAIFDRSPCEEVIVRGWLFALLGYAELTCVPGEATAEEPAVAQHTEGARNRSPNGRRRSTPEPRPLRKPRRYDGGGARGTSVLLPPSLVPTAPTRRYLASYVAGHKRHLSVGRHPSPDARKRAEHLGIALGPSETWVRPHARGVPDDAALVFEWKAAPAPTTTA
jgi:hypothetical protein